MCYWCGWVMHILNHCEIKETIAIDHLFDRTGNLHSHQQQAADKGDEQTVESDADVSVSSTKTSGWSGLQTSLYGRQKVTKDGSDLREIVSMDSVTTINLFGNPNMITNRRK